MSAWLTREQLDGLEAMAMDMWPPYIQATLAKVPNAADKVVFDRFPIMGYVGKAVDTVRKQDPRERRELGDETLKGTKMSPGFLAEPFKKRNRYGHFIGAPPPVRGIVLFLNSEIVREEKSRVANKPA